MGDNFDKQKNRQTPNLTDGIVIFAVIVLIIRQRFKRHNTSEFNLKLNHSTIIDYGTFNSK